MADRNASLAIVLAAAGRYTPRGLELDAESQLGGIGFDSLDLALALSEQVPGFERHNTGWSDATTLGDIAGEVFAAMIGAQ